MSLRKKFNKSLSEYELSAEVCFLCRLLAVLIRRLRRVRAHDLSEIPWSITYCSKAANKAQYHIELSRPRSIAEVTIVSILDSSYADYKKIVKIHCLGLQTSPKNDLAFKALSSPPK